ncbi:MAG: 2-hydroxyacid dehydrogenase [Lautropia sp.]
MTASAPHAAASRAADPQAAAREPAAPLAALPRTAAAPAGAAEPADVAAGRAPAPRIALLSRSLDLGFLVPEILRQAPDAVVATGPDAAGFESAEVAVCWNPPFDELSRMRELRLVQSIAAGVDHLLIGGRLPVDVPICRVLDPGMAAGMSAYVCWAVIHRQRHFDRMVAAAAKQQWQEQPIVPPQRHRVGIAGLGWLGSACARALLAIGYDVCGWTRGGARPAVPGVALYHGDEQRDEFLAGCDTLVCLLPLTAATEGFLSKPVFDALPRGAHVINAGRGAHLVEADLLAAIAEGRVGAATLDAFASEPLPPDHPFWREPRILVTPHIASRTSVAMIVTQTLDNLARVRRGERPPASVDPARGY